jgi:hypothetical protein
VKNNKWFDLTDTDLAGKTGTKPFKLLTKIGGIPW